MAADETVVSPAEIVEPIPTGALQSATDNLMPMDGDLDRM